VRINPTDEDYLQTFLELEEDGIRPIAARLSERLRISAAAVSEAIHRLVGRGFAVEQDRVISLTPAGQAAGRAVIRRHRLAECFLVQLLGLPWEQAHREAARWEHVISADVEARMVAVLGDPPVCPHGNPIPGSGRSGPSPTGTPLAESPPGRVRLVRISEQAQTDDDAIAFLAAAGLLPGATVEVVDGAPVDGVRVRSDRGEWMVPASIARLLWAASG
jgi:DtxR family Mn-dependent transcriptional regulator